MARGRLSGKTQASLAGHAAGGNSVICTAAANCNGCRDGRSISRSSKPRHGLGGAVRRGRSVISILPGLYDALYVPRRSCPTLTRRS